VKGVDVVLHYDPAEDHKAYLHRSGRTARAGGTGVAVSLVLWDQERETEGLQKRLGINPNRWSRCSPTTPPAGTWRPGNPAVDAEAVGEAEAATGTDGAGPAGPASPPPPSASLRPRPGPARRRRRML